MTESVLRRWLKSHAGVYATAMFEWPRFAAHLYGVRSPEDRRHVALALDSNSSLDSVREILHAHDCWENPLMRDGPLVNHEIHSAALYLDIPGRQRTRRLEFITPNPAG